MVTRETGHAGVVVTVGTGAGVTVVRVVRVAGQVGQRVGVLRQCHAMGLHHQRLRHRGVLDHLIIVSLWS